MNYLTLSYLIEQVVLVGQKCALDPVVVAVMCAP